MISKITQAQLGKAIKMWNEAVKQLCLQDRIDKSNEEIAADLLKNYTAYVYSKLGEVQGLVAVNAKNEIVCLCVDPIYRHHGIGTTLLAHCKDIHKKLYLCIPERNTRAICFMEQCDFKKAKQVEEAICILSWHKS